MFCRIAATCLNYCSIGRSSNILFNNALKSNIIPIATFKDLPEPPKVEVTGFPETSRIKILPKQPTYPSYLKPPKMTRRLKHMRGPETVHNKLIHNQYGIMALSGGSLKYGHYEMIRNGIMRNLDRNKMFAVWRIDGPSKPKTKHGHGKKLGGGTGAIDHYILPIKRGRMIIEVGGQLPFDVVFRSLQEIAEKLPFPAAVVNQEILDKWQKEEDMIKSENINKLNWEWCIKNNILNSIQHVGRYDIEFSHLGPDCR